jgi:hypothetical protein
MRARARERWLALAAALVALLASWLALGGRLERPDEDELYGDETCWVAISILHWRQLVHGDPPAGAELDPPRWQDRGPWERGVQHTGFGYPSPCFAKLVWGAALDIAGFRSASPLVFTVFAQRDLEDARKVRKDLEPALPIARGIVLALACLCTLLIGSVAKTTMAGSWGWLAAALAVALWLASPLVRSTASDARTDYFMLAFELGALALALSRPAALAGRLGSRAQWLLGLSLGLMCGLSVSSKLNGAPLGVCIALWFVVLGWPKRKGALGTLLRGPGLALILAGLTACAVFWALNPRLHAEPIAGVADILARWRELFAYFQDDWAPRSGIATAHTLPQRAVLFASNAFGRDDAWHALAGVPGLGAFLACAGLALLALRALRANSDAEQERAQILLAFALVTLAATVAWLPIDWQRYYLTAAPALAIAQALALASAIRWIARRVRASRTS